MRLYKPGDRVFVKGVDSASNPISGWETIVKVIPEWYIVEGRNIGFTRVHIRSINEEITSAGEFER